MMVESPGVDELTPSVVSLHDQLAGALDLATPIPDAVLERAATDELFLYHLGVCRGNPTLLSALIDAEVRRSKEQNAISRGSGNATVRIEGRHIARALKSVGKWLRHGLPVVDGEHLARRLAACSVCPELTVPAGILVGAAHGLGLIRPEEKACGVCGCVVARKALLSTEACPLTHPADELLTRWGEPILQ